MTKQNKKKLSKFPLTLNEFHKDQVLSMVNNLDPFTNNLLWLLINQAAKQHSDSGVIHIPGEVVQSSLNYDENKSHEEFTDEIRNGLIQLGRVSGIGIDKDNREFMGNANLFKETRIYLDNFELQIQVDEEYRKFFKDFITLINSQKKSTTIDTNHQNFD